MQNKINWIIIALLSLSLLLGFSIAFRNQTALINFFSTDDAFYYFQSAKNFTEGKGISFDGIARGNGYHPLWMMVCIPVFAFARMDLWLPLRILVVIQALMHTTTGYFIYRLLAQRVTKPLALLAMSIWLFSPTIFSLSGSTGLETGINLLCISALLYYTSSWNRKPLKEIGWKQYLVSGILAAITLLARLDNIYLLCFIGAWLVLKDSKLNRPMVFIDFFLAAFSVILSYLLYIGLPNAYVNMAPQMKLIVVISMVVFPVGQFFTGIYHHEQTVCDKKTIIFRILLASVFSTAVLIGTVVVFFRYGGYSRFALPIQGGIFALVTLIVKLSLPLPPGRMGVQEKYSLKAVFTLQWDKLITKSVAYFGPLFSVLSSFLIFNHFYFGTAMPLSGRIKEWWGTLSTVYGTPANSLVKFLGLDLSGPWAFFYPFYRVKNMDRMQNSILLFFVILILVAIFVFFRRSEKLRKHLSDYAFFPITMGIFFHFSYYTMTGYMAYRPWYWQPEKLYLLLFLTLVLDSAASQMEKRWPKVEKYNLDWKICGWVSMVLVAIFLNYNLSTYPFIPKGPAPSLHNARMLQQCTPAGSLIGMTGGGYIGYFIEDHTIVNLDGLINGVEYYQYLSEFRMDEYLELIGVEYVFGKETMLLNSDPFMVPLNGRLVEYDPPGCTYQDSFILYQFISEN